MCKPTNIWDTQTCWLAAQKGHLSCLRQAHEKGCPWDVFTLYEAIKHHHLDCFFYAVEKGCPHTSLVTYYVAREGNVALMDYCRKKGILFHESSLREATKYGHLVLVQYLLEHNSPWDEEVPEVAVRYGYLDILDVLFQKHLLTSLSYLIKIAILYDQAGSLRWILRHSTLSHRDIRRVEKYALEKGYISFLLHIQHPFSFFFYKAIAHLHDYLPRDLITLICDLM
jgi:hypothetical protein